MVFWCYVRFYWFTLGFTVLQQPYENYSDFDFNIPIGRHGDSYDRYLIRIQEMREAISIVNQALSTIVEGPVKIDNNKLSTPS